MKLIDKVIKLKKKIEKLKRISKPTIFGKIVTKWEVYKTENEKKRFEMLLRCKLRNLKF